VLKIEGPHEERYTEMIALRLYEGRCACKCLEADEDAGAVLLERIVPGHDLRTLPSKRAQLEIGAELVAGLPIPVNETYGLPLYVDWVTNAIATTRARVEPDTRMTRLMTVADELFREICPGDAPQALLHGDLHHENMLENRNGEWKAIDPQGVIGAPFLETARFIENHAIDDAGLSLETLDEAVAYLAERLGETKRIIGSAVYVLHVLSTCWGYEMNYDRERIAQQINECEDLLKYVRSV
jgi:streptomycin 6-kinase